MNVIQDNSETIERINARSLELSDAQGCEGKCFEEDLENASSTEMIKSCEGNDLFRMNSKPETEQGSDRLQYDISSQESCQVEIGDIGYKFSKLFDEGWFEGRVADINHDLGEKSRHCVYSDGDSEYLSIEELKQLLHYERWAINENKKKIISGSTTTRKG